MRSILGSSSDPHQLSGGLNMRRKPPCIARSLAVCSIVLGSFRSLQFWLSCFASRPIQLHFPSRNSDTTWECGSASQRHARLLVCSVMSSVADGSFTSEIQMCSSWCFDWQGSGLCRTAEVTGHSALEANSANWLRALFAFIFYVFRHTAYSPTGIRRWWFYCVTIYVDRHFPKLIMPFGSEANFARLSFLILIHSSFFCQACILFHRGKTKDAALRTLKAVISRAIPLWPGTLTCWQLAAIALWVKKKMDPPTERFCVGSSEDQHLQQSLANQNNSPV